MYGVPGTIAAVNLLQGKADPSTAGVAIIIALVVSAVIVWAVMRWGDEQ